MNLSPTLEDAIALACAAHNGQRDKAGEPYILHPLRVMENLGAGACDVARMAAVLHDVVEDSPITPDILRERGYSEELIKVLSLLTKREGDDYETFIRRLAPHPIARRVKLADLQDNMRLERIADPQPRDYERLEKYQRAWDFLQSLESGNNEPRPRGSGHAAV